MDVNSGDVAWVLASTALVLLMTPGLAFFYGGMTKAKSTLNMMLMSFATICVVSILWVIFGFSLAFGNSGSGFYGAFSLSGLSDAVNAVTNNGGVYGIPLLLFAGFQLMFAVITPALISGAIADRTKFLTWVIFVAIWVTIVSQPRPSSNMRTTPLSWPLARFKRLRMTAICFSSWSVCPSNALGIVILSRSVNTP